MQGARRGTQFRVSRITPETEGGAKPLSHPGLPMKAYLLHEVNHNLEADDPSSDKSSRGQYWPNAMSQCLCHSLHFISSLGILSSHIKRRERNQQEEEFLQTQPQVQPIRKYHNSANGKSSGPWTLAFLQ
ncbi:hypothetical protein VULLAG_LOCUS15044 [Vulpes lagopus]